MQAPPTNALRNMARRGLQSATSRVLVPTYEGMRRRLPLPIRDGVTVVTVSHRALECVQALAFAVRHFSPPATTLMVIDNASGHEVRDWLRGQHWFRSLCLPVNVGHGRALDLGFAMARTEYVVALDVDAFPISSEWLEVVLSPLRRGEAAVSGGGFTSPVPRVNGDGVVHAGYAGKPFVHPSFLAMRRARFVERHHSFRDSSSDWDTGESISLREHDVAIVEPTSIRGPTVVGTVFGDVVYHNFYTTRARRDDRTVIDGMVPEDEPARAWDEAVERYLRPLPGWATIDHHRSHVDEERRD